MAGRVLLLAASLVVGLLIAEGVTRLLIGPPAFFLFTGPFRDVQTDWDVSYGIDSDQTRRSFRVFSDSKPKRRIAVVGDSFVFGEGVEDAESFVALLNRTYGSRDIVFDNFGIIGANLRNYSIVIRDLVDERHSDMVLLIYGNDFLDGFYRPTIRGQLARLPDLLSTFSVIRRAVDGARVATFRANLGHSIPNNPTSIIERDARYFVRAVDPSTSEITETLLHLEHMLDRLRDRHPEIQVWLALVPEASTVSSRYRAFIAEHTNELPEFGAPGKAYRAVETLASNLGVRFVDIFPAFIHACEELYFAHDLHFSPQGHALMSALLASALLGEEQKPVPCEVRTGRHSENEKQLGTASP